MRAKWVLMAALAALVTVGCAAPLQLTSRTVIVVEEKQPDKHVRWAANELQDWLRKATDSKRGFEIVSTRPAPGTRPAIVLNDQRVVDFRTLNRLGRDGYVMRRKGDVITITGRKPEGTYHGAMAFLDRFCGVKFYMPSDLFTSLPRDRRVVVRKVEVTRTPFVTSGYMSGIDHDSPLDAPWVRRVGGWRRLGGTHQHNMFNVFPTTKYAKRWPEIYPTFSGKRYFPKGQQDQAWQPCFTEPRLVDAGTESAVAYFRKHPDHQYLSFSIQDSHRMCECARCMKVVKAHQARDPKHGRTAAYSLIYWSYINKLAVRLEAAAPGKRITALAYGDTRFAPPFKLERNVVVFTNYHIAELPNDGFMTRTKFGVSPLDNWLNKASAYGNHDWYQGGGYLIPRLYSGHWSRFIRHLAGRVSDAYMHAECYPNWGFAGPKYYILSRLWWNPKSDVDSLLDRFCDDMFGPASRPMEKYFITLEKLWVQLDLTEGPERKLFRWQTQFDTTDKSMAMVKQCRALLDEAKGLAATADEKKRIDLFSRSFRISEYLFEIAAAEKPDKALYETAQKYINDLVKNDRMVYHWRHTKHAARTLYWATLRRSYAAQHAPKIATPELDGKAWPGAATATDFVLPSGGKDTKSTRVQLGHDGEFLYLSVTCPRDDMDRLIETHDKSWRSDNIEIFVDNNGDKSTFERHGWVKTTGRFVDWPPRPRKGLDRVRTFTKKLDDRLIVQVALPFDYLGVAPTPGATFRIQLFRNEFIARRVRNELRYAAFWSGKLTLE